MTKASHPEVLTQKGPRQAITRSHEPTVWVCAACGKHGPSRRTVGDESCYLHAVECWRSSLVFDDWRVARAVVASEPWVEPEHIEPPATKTEAQLASDIRRVARRLERRSLESNTVEKT